MRKLILVFALVASTLGVIGVAPAVSSAAGANCQPNVRPVVYTGYWEWQAVLLNCTQVSGVRFASVSTGLVYLVDNRDHSVHFSIAGGGDTFLGVAPQYRSTPYKNIVWGAGCGAPFFYIYKAYAFQLRNANGNTWGNMTPTFGPWEAIC